MGRSDLIRVPLPAARMIAEGRCERCVFMLMGCRVWPDARNDSRGGEGRSEGRGAEGRRDELGDMDSNHDKQNQNLLCYRYTIAQ